MKNPNLGRNQKENNPMWHHPQSEKTRKLQSEAQIKRNKNLNRLLFMLRDDQLNERIKSICHTMLLEKLNQQNAMMNE